MFWIWHFNEIQFTLVEEKPQDQLNPCVPSPCGHNAVCREQNGVGSCTCLPNYHGNPYEGCRPECVLNSECSSDRACIQNRCVDPCPGTCGSNAECHVINHLPSCTCVPSYTGDAMRFCHPIPTARKFIGFNRRWISVVLYQFH